MTRATTPASPATLQVRLQRGNWGQTLSEILTGTVLADGTLVLKLYYEPTAQSITLNTGAGAWNDSEGFYNATWNADKTQGVDSTIPTEKTLTVPSRNSATRDGYTLAGWTTITTYDIINGQITAGSRYNIADATGQRSRDIVAWLESLNAALAANPSAGGTDPNGGRQYFACGTSFVLPPNGAVLIAVWQANTNTAYTVEHIKLVNDGTTITEKIELTENLTGITGETVTGIAQTYPGYTFVANGQTAYPGQSYVTIAQGVIAGNGSLVLKLYYTANTNTTYTVERWIASADGKLLTKVDVKTLTGTTDTSVTPASSDPLGYTLDNSFVPSTISGAGDWPNAAIPTAVIAGDGSTKIIQFYIPIDVLYTVEFYRYTGDGKVLPFNGFETAAGKDYAEFIAGSSVPVWIDGTSTGTATNKVKGWGKTSSTLSVDRPAGISASAGFTYAHLNLSAAENPNFIGYTYDETFEQVINGVTYKTIAQGTILADGSLLLKLFYVADTLNLVYNTGSEATTVTFQKNHSSESTFTLPIDANEGSIVERDGYTLVGWTVASHYTGTDAASFALVGADAAGAKAISDAKGYEAQRLAAWLGTLGTDPDFAAHWGQTLNADIANHMGKTYYAQGASFKIGVLSMTLYAVWTPTGTTEYTADIYKVKGDGTMELVGTKTYNNGVADEDTDTLAQRPAQSGTSGETYDGSLTTEFGLAGYRWILSTEEALSFSGMPTNTIAHAIVNADGTTKLVFIFRARRGRLRRESLPCRR